MQDQSITIRKIADMLLLNGTLTDNPGLVQGKIGITVFFFHYAQYTGNMLFADYALYLISEMQNQIHVNSPADYENGIAGIGNGIDYLIQNSFLNADADIFEDFDQRMYRAVMYDPWKDFSQYGGLIGYGQYWISRLRQVSSMQAQECLLYITEKIEENLSNISIEEQIEIYCFLQNLQKISGFNNAYFNHFKQCLKWDISSVDINRCLSRLGDSIAGNIIRIYQCSHYFNTSLQIDISLKQIPDFDFEKPPISMGLLNGYAGEGMMRLTMLNQTNSSWIHLL